MKKQTIKQPINALTSLVAVSALAISLSIAKGTTVLSDNFNRTGALVGSSAQIGGTWTGSGPTLGGSIYDTAGGSYQAFDTFTSALSAGEAITLNYDTLVPASGASTVFTGWGGVSLFSGGTEIAFTGNSALGSWGTDGSTSFWINPPTAPVTNPDGDYHDQASGDSTVVNHITFTYNYTSGAYSFSTENITYSGTAATGFALDNLRIGNGAGDQFAIDNLIVDISPVPEPASMALLGLGGLGLALYRRRRA